MNFTERIPGIGIEDVEFYSLGEVEIDQELVAAFIAEKKIACAGRMVPSCSDLVIAYLFTKEYESALLLSTELVSEFTDEYNVVITHAAALELNGKPAEAIPFMERALELNSGSHKGSEWIHLSLLKERVRGGVPDPWALIGVKLRPDSALMFRSHVDYKQLLRQVHFQVNDRRFFTPVHDPLYGALLFTYADLLQLNHYRSQAKQIYDLAKAYGFSYSGPVKVEAISKVDTPQELEVQEAPGAELSRPEEKERGISTVLWVVLGLLATGLVLFLWSKRKRP